jgi:hypothetical protein
VLVEADVIRADPQAVEKDLEKTKALMAQYAGAIQVRGAQRMQTGEA